MTKIKIALVDDDKLIVEGLKMILSQDEELQITNTAYNGAELFEQIKEGSFEAEIILLDISMPVLDGIDTLLKINELKLPYRVIILTSYYNDGMIIRFLDEGASGFLAKNEAPDEVIKTIKNVAAKGFHINDYIVDLIRLRKLKAKSLQIQEELSEREKEVLRLICQEYTNKEIADLLFISPRTVDGHRNRLLEKINCKNTAGMVLYAIENKLFDLPSTRYI
jgi:DNA-binding NarL/FixJ family response regulator